MLIDFHDSPYYAYTKISSHNFFCHRSLFVPYFKYLIDGSTRYLTEQDNDSNSLSQKHKKRKINGDIKLKNGSLSPEKWHLRALILNSLYKCFLYDTGNLKFLNATNFQVSFFNVMFFLVQIIGFKLLISKI